MKLLIHHHAPAFADEQGIHVQSFIGCWVNAMSPYFMEIGLLLPVTGAKSNVQDTLILESNIKLYPLPLGGQRWDYFKRKRKIRAVCGTISQGYDALLVRGITPRQWTVWQSCRVPKKFFLLVGSILGNRPKFGWRLPLLLTWALSYVRRWEFKQISQEAFLLANSPRLLQEIETFCGRKAQFVSTNTLQEAQIRPLQLREIGNPCRLLFCGRVVKDKGIEELIIALALLNKQGGVLFQLRVVGSIKAGYKHYLEQLATRHNVENKITWAGFVPFGAALLAFYEHTDFMVLPSYHEGFPHSIWEASAHSVPVITTKVGGIPGLMDDRMVQFIEKGSAQDIADKVSTLLKDKRLRWDKVSALHQFAQNFSVERGAESLANIIKSA